MSRRSPSSPWTRFLGLAALLVGAIALGATAPAYAGFGDLVKKAKDKATKKEEPEEEVGASEDVVFDSEILELTEARLAKIIAACKTMAAEEAAAQATRDELNAKIGKIEEARSKLWDKDGEKIQDLRRKRDEVESCRHDGYQEATERRTKEYADKAVSMDPAIIAKFQAIAAKNNAAAARGDTTAINRANSEMMAFMTPTHEDTVAITKKCGTKPGPHPSEATLAKLDDDLAAANEELRKFDKKVMDDHAESSGMSRSQFAAALERIRNYRMWRRDKKRDHMRGYSDEEVKAIENHLADLKGC